MLRLNLQNNFISAIYEDDFALNWAESLASLSLSNNGLVAIEEYAFIHVKGLKELRLSGNSIKYLHYHRFTLPNLQTLELSFSENVFVLQFLMALTKDPAGLRFLQLNYNSIYSLPANVFHHLRLLIHCDLEGNLLKQVNFFPDPDINKHSKLK